MSFELQATCNNSKHSVLLYSCSFWKCDRDLLFVILTPYLNLVPEVNNFTFVITILVTLSSGESGRTYAVPHLCLRGLPGAVPPGAHDPLPVLRSEVGWLLTRPRHYVLIRHLHGNAVLRRPSEGELDATSLPAIVRVADSTVGLATARCTARFQKWDGSRSSTWLTLYSWQRRAVPSDWRWARCTKFSNCTQICWEYCWAAYARCTDKFQKMRSRMAALILRHVLFMAIRAPPMRITLIICQQPLEQCGIFEFHLTQTTLSFCMWPCYLFT